MTNVLILTVSRKLWRKIRFGALFQSITTSHQNGKEIGVCTTHLTMDKSYSVKTSNLEDKLQHLSLKSNLTIAVEGNIGSGKSTLLQYFGQSELIETICEPLDKWTNVKGHNALGLLYEDSQRWSFSFNMYALLTRVNMHTKVHAKPVKMLDRSLYSTRNCFIQNSYMNEDLSKFEYSILNQWYNHLISDNKADIDLIVYVRADPDVCYERLKKRSRKEEASVPKALLESLHELHDDWLIREKYPLPAPVLVLDANSDLSSMKEKYDQTRQEILLSVNS